MIPLHDPRLATHVTHMSQASLLPIVPILLLPFILIFFVVVVPIWGIALGVVGLALVIMRALAGLARLAGVSALDDATASVHRAFRWVLTFGGFTERFAQASK